MQPQRDSLQTLVIIGNGMVGYKLCEKLVGRRKDERDELLSLSGVSRHFRIVVFGEEPSPAYDRVHLTEFFADADAGKLLVAPEKWYAENEIELHLGEAIESIDRTRRVVQSKHGVRVHYDKLVFATGSYPFVPPIDGVELPGVFVYRTIAFLSCPQKRFLTIGLAFLWTTQGSISNDK